MSQKINTNSNEILNQIYAFNFGQAQTLVQKAQDLANSVFDRPSQEIKEGIDLLSKQIQDLTIQGNSLNDESRRILRQASDFVSNVKEQLQIKDMHIGVMNTFQTGNKPLIVSGTQSQFTGAENGLGNSACPIIAMIALKQMLLSEINNAEQINQLTQMGIEEYGNAITRVEDKGFQIAYGDHLDWDLQTEAMPEFEQNGDLIGINLSVNAQKDYLDALQKFAARLQIGQKSGGTLTLPPETYSLTIEKMEEGEYEVLFFDSHGHHDTTGTSNAYMIRFLSLNDAARFLEKRHSYIKDAGLMNFGIFLPLTLNEVADDLLVKDIRKAANRLIKKTIDHSVIQKDLLNERIDKFMSLANETFKVRTDIPSQAPVQRELQYDYRQAVDILENVHKQFSQRNREEGLFEIMTLQSLQASLGQMPNFEQRLYFHLYFLHKKLGKSKDVDDYGRKAFWHEDNFKAEDTEIAEVAKRTSTEMLLNVLLEAIDCNNVDKLREYHDLLGAVNEGCRNELNGLIYNLAAFMYKGNPKININHSDFGKVGFRNEEGFKAPNDIKIAAINALIEKNKKNWNIS